MREVAYFVNNLKVHKSPGSSSCKVKHTGEQLYSSPSAGYEKCDDCFKLAR